MGNATCAAYSKIIVFPTLINRTQIILSKTVCLKKSCFEGQYLTDIRRIVIRLFARIRQQPPFG